jgi:uncharacterized membrane protein
MRGRELWERGPGRLRRLTRAEVEHIVFWVALLLKAGDAILEVLGGFILIFISAETINQVVHGLVRPELAEDPTDVLAHYILRLMGHTTSTSKQFAMIYLLSHGTIKLFIVGTIWLRRWWAYPLAGLVFAGFIVYQLVRFAYTFSLWMIVLTVLDLIIIALLPSEYRRLKREIERHKERR